MEQKIKKNLRILDGGIKATRTTFLVKVSTLEMVKAYAYWKRMPIQEVIDQAINEFLVKPDVLMTLHDYMENNSKKVQNGKQ